MALSSLKPSSRGMRTSPHQTDDSPKDVNCYLLGDHDEEDHTSIEEEKIKSHQMSANKKVPAHENDDDAASSSFSDKSYDKPCCQEDLPTFVAHQGMVPIKLQRKYERKAGQTSSSWFKRSDRRSMNPDEQQVFSPLFTKTRCFYTLPDYPQSASKVSLHASISNLRFSGEDSRFFVGKQGHYDTQRPAIRKESGVEKGRSSCASVEEASKIIEARSSHCSRDHHARRSSSWEDEVRQAMARSFICRNQSEEALGFQRSSSVKDHTPLARPSSLLVRTNGGVSSVEGGPKRLETSSPRMNGVENGNRGEVRSPSAERWEEAAEVEEQKELRRCGRSQSMRYEALPVFEVLGGGRPWDSQCSSRGNVSSNDHEWAVYKKTGYVDVQLHADAASAGSACCNSTVGRSFSMRDTRMGLVMECAACGTGLRDAGGRLLCLCSCCATNHGSSVQGGQTATSNKKGGLLRACRRLLGLGKKRSSEPARDRIEAILRR